MIGDRVTWCGPIRIAWTDAVGSSSERALVGRALLARLLREVDDSVDHAITHRCVTCGGNHGRPIDTAGTVALSVSYAGSLVVVAAASIRDAAAIGVDVERESGASGRRLDELALLFAPAPPPDIAEWTAIEAVLKADGRGLQVPPQEVVLSEAAGRILPGGRIATIPGRAGALEVAPVAAPSGFVISVAIDPGSGSAR